MKDKKASQQSVKNVSPAQNDTMALDQWVERCVIVYRDENGYGFMVSGDNPICVESIKEGSAASKAGVRIGDKILKVNGTSVSSKSHMDVVKLISSSSEHIALTLFSQCRASYCSRNLKRSPATFQSATPVVAPPPHRQASASHITASAADRLSQAGFGDGHFSYFKRPSASYCAQTTLSRHLTGSTLHKNDRLITNPLPVDEEKQVEWRRRRYQILKQMYDDETNNVKELEANLKAHFSDENEHLLIQAKNRLSNLQNNFADEFKMSLQPKDSLKGPSSSSSTIGGKVLMSKSFDAASAKDDLQLKHENRSNVSLQSHALSASANVDTGGHLLELNQADNKNIRTALGLVRKNIGACPVSGSTGHSAGEQDRNLSFVQATAEVNIMDDSDSDTDAVVPLETEGPFSNIADLKNRPAHLSVFLHYLLSNCDPSSLLFFLVADIYSHGNNAKDMRKWAYEIHSTFLTPTAPLKVTSIDKSIVQEIDNTLNHAGNITNHATTSNHGNGDSNNQHEQDEILRKIFVKARQKALDDINDSLADYRNKRIMGVGTLFGETKLSGLLPGDLNRERQIIESLIMQHLKSLFDLEKDYYNLSCHQQALATSIATILKHFGVKPADSAGQALLDKCPLFVAKEKKTFSLLSKPSKKPAQIKGHNFHLGPILATTTCYQCQDVIWGVNAKAYVCSNCQMNLHKPCASTLIDACNGVKATPPRKQPAQPQLSSSVGKSSSGGATSLRRDDSGDSESFRSVNVSSGAVSLIATSIIASPPPIVNESTCDQAMAGGSTDNEDLSSENDDKTTDLPGSPATGFRIGDQWTTTISVSADSGYGGDATASGAHLLDKLGANVGRSQSMKSHQEEIRSSKRNGESGRRTKSDVDTDDKSIAMAIGTDRKSQTHLQQPSSSSGQETASSRESSAAASSSSLSRASGDSPPAGGIGTAYPSTSKPSLDSTASTLTTGSDDAASLLAPATPTAPVSTNEDDDSDMLADNEMPRLEEFLDWDTVKMLKPKEKKRQEVLNELFHTEKTHVRNLKILNKVFYEPLKSSNVLKHEHVESIFGNLAEVLDMHTKLNASMKLMVKKNRTIGDVGSMLLTFFDGSSGERFKKAVSIFCQNQQHALEILKQKQKKDPKFLQFLQDAESSSKCRKLGLKDMLPMEMQRLTKYPLLLETAIKYTQDPSEEFDCMRRCVACARNLLDNVNTAKRNAENKRRLEDLQRRLDTRDFDRIATSSNHQEYKNLDLRRASLVHDGPLMWRLNKNKAVDLYVLLSDELLILLTRASDGQRLSLKFHTINVGSSRDNMNFTHCPLIKLSTMIAKDVATDKKAFFIVSTLPQGPQIYELVAQSTSEKKNWFKLITEQIDSCKQLEQAHSIPAPITPSVDRNEIVVAESQKSTPTKSARKLSSHPSQEEKFNASASDTSQSIDEEGLPMERIQMSNQPRLIQPSEVQICKPTVLEHAQPILTPYERLKRHDEMIIKSLVEKHRILTETFGFDEETVLKISDMMAEGKSTRDAKESALAAVVQTNRMLEAINNAMKIEPPDSGSTSQHEGDHNASHHAIKVSIERPAVSCIALTRIAAPLMKHLTGLMHGLQNMDDQIRQLQCELRNCKSQQQKNSPIETALLDGGEISTTLSVKTGSPPRAASMSELRRNRAASSRSPSPPGAMTRRRSRTPDGDGAASTTRRCLTTTTSSSGGAASDDIRRRERLRHKRQRNAASLAGASVAAAAADDDDTSTDEAVV